MTVKDLISKKDYDYIEWRVTMPKDSGVSDEFFGACMSKNGKLYPLDHDSYYDGEEAVSYEEWSNENVSNGLTVVIQTDWISENGFAE